MVAKLVIMKFQLMSSGNRTHDIANNSVREAWLDEELKMVDLDFSQELIDFYEAEVMNPDRYAIRNNLSRDVPEECGTFNAIGFMTQRQILLSPVPKSHLSLMVTLQMALNIVTT